MTDPYAWPRELQAAFLRALGDPVDVSVLWGTPVPRGEAIQDDFNTMLARLDVALGPHGNPVPFTVPHQGTHAPHTGPRGSQPHPVTPHRLSLWGVLNRHTTTTTPGEYPEPTEETEMHDSPEQAEPTPVQRREAWLSLMGEMERSLAASMLNARALAGTSWAIPDRAGYLATEYAARRLLSELGNLHAPEVPRDDSLGQDAIPMPEEVSQCRDKMCAATTPAGCRYPNWRMCLYPDRVAQDISTGTVLEPAWRDDR